ncbi:MAG: hypothetical protein ABR570_02820 [Burkholderiales bacterium]
MKSPAVLLIGKTRDEATLASAALYCAGARIVTARPDLALLVEAKATSHMPKHLFVPLVAIVPRGEKRKVLNAGADAAYARPRHWKAYARLVERVLAEWTITRRGARPRRARSS